MRAAAGVAAALRANEELCLVGVYRGRRKESVVGIRGASKLAIEINRGQKILTQNEPNCSEFWRIPANLGPFLTEKLAFCEQVRGCVSSS